MLKFRVEGHQRLTQVNRIVAVQSERRPQSERVRTTLQGKNAITEQEPLYEISPIIPDVEGQVGAVTARRRNQACLIRNAVELQLEEAASVLLLVKQVTLGNGLPDTAI